MNDKVAVIIQARTGSTRLPGKVLADIAGEPMLTFLVKRLRRCTLVDDYILATTISGNDDVLATLGNELDLIVSRGSEEDVLSRYAFAAEKTEAQVIVRITGDCPLTDPELLDQMLAEFTQGEYDYYSNCGPPTYPDGLE